MPDTCGDCRSLTTQLTASLAALTELRSAAISFRRAAYDAEPRLVVGNEAVSRLAATLHAAEKIIERMS